MAPAFFVTGSDTGVGKTVLAGWLVRRLVELGWRTTGLKPIASGGRDDALALLASAGAGRTLDEVNPWHFSQPVAPVLAARLDRRRVRLATVARWIAAVRRGWEATVVEGAGGLLSPLGEGFDNRDLLSSMRGAAVAVVVCPNRLGVVNQARLVLEALPAARRAAARLALMNQARPDSSAGGNARLIAGYWPNRFTAELPWRDDWNAAGLDAELRGALDRLLPPRLRREPVGLGAARRLRPEGAAAIVRK